jgi:hypothetical protein
MCGVCRCTLYSYCPPEFSSSTETERTTAKGKSERMRARKKKKKKKKGEEPPSQPAPNSAVMGRGETCWREKGLDQRRRVHPQKKRTDSRGALVCTRSGSVAVHGRAEEAQSKGGCGLPMESVCWVACVSGCDGHG